MYANPFIWLIDTLLEVYIWLLIAQAILSWLLAFGVINRYNRAVSVIGDFLLPGDRASIASDPDSSAEFWRGRYFTNDSYRNYHLLAQSPVLLRCPVFLIFPPTPAADGVRFQIRLASVSQPHAAALRNAVALAARPRPWHCSGP